jgi:hypothetical protein
MKIAEYPIHSGRLIKENGAVVNCADGINADGSRNVQLTGRKARIDVGNHDQVLSVAPGASVIITITPPAGEMWRIILLRIVISGILAATTGTHTCEVRVASNASVSQNVLKAVSNRMDGISTSCNVIDAGTNSKLPTTEQAQQAAILSLRVTNAAPLYIIYTNNTDDTQNQNAAIRITREVETIA